MNVDNKKKQPRRGVGATLAITLACLLTGCGNIWGYTHPDGSGGGFVDNLFRGIHFSSSSTPKKGRIPADAYPGAGEKRIPSGAVELLSSTDRSDFPLSDRQYYLPEYRRKIWVWNRELLRR